MAEDDDATSVTIEEEDVQDDVNELDANEDEAHDDGETYNIEGKTNAFGQETIEIYVCDYCYQEFER